jgi:hypothetical protein
MAGGDRARRRRERGCQVTSGPERRSAAAVPGSSEFGPGSRPRSPPGFPIPLFCKAAPAASDPARRGRQATCVRRTVSAPG